MSKKVMKWVALCTGTLFAAAVPGCDTITQLLGSLGSLLPGLA